MATIGKRTGVDYSCFDSALANAGASMTDENSKAITIHVLPPGGDNTIPLSLNERELMWMRANQFTGDASGEAIALPDGQGGIGKIVLILEDTQDLWSFSKLRQQLPGGSYSIKFYSSSSLEESSSSGFGPSSAAALGWMLGAYSFNRYKSSDSSSESPDKNLLVWPQDLSAEKRKSLVAIAEGIYFARDMVSTPAEEMAPQHIEMEARSLADRHSASLSCITGDNLLKENYPAIHTVGRACTNEPRLIDLRWKNPSASKRITLVGKGVSFDTGGLDLKPAAAMKLMKKDMGGAALVLGLAHTIMSTNLNIELRVLVPAVENSVAGNAFRPLDVLQTRSGITVENGNTDAEGRLILCDALAEAASENPDLILDAATLTGAARVALGTDMPALFCTCDEASENIIKISKNLRDFMWPMPLHAPYRAMINSKVADIGSCSEGGYAGAITAALFLKEFVKDYSGVWAHVDTMGYNISSKPGRPEGGEALALRTLYEFISKF
jgi:leucyl aminopeptidase